VSGRRRAAISARVATTWSSPRTPCVAPPPPRPRARRYTAFIIELRTHGGLQWVVERRFSQVRWRARAAATAAVCALPATPPRLARRARALTLIPQFYKLNQILKQRYDELRLFKFPQKRWFSSFATQTVEQRRRVFEVYLLELLSLQPRPVELNTFLDINQHIWGGARDDGVPSDRDALSARAPRPLGEHHAVARGDEGSQRLVRRVARVALVKHEPRRPEASRELVEPSEHGAQVRRTVARRPADHDAVILRCGTRKSRRSQ
jgi:hypothetical protein